MITENLSTLKIHKLTQAQYDRELANGTLDENALYLTPDETIDLSGYATVEQLNEKVDKGDITEMISRVSNLENANEIKSQEIEDLFNRVVSLEEKISYSTIDLVAGSSLLETGKLYFVYE